MGAQPSTPVPGTPFRVIGAGLSRTGTSSFSVALSILLNGPVYHGGTQVVLRAPTEIKHWIKVLKHYPPTSPSDRANIQRGAKERLDGYAAVTDVPANGLVEELMELYPDAIVICTTRDAQGWVKSMDTLNSLTLMAFLRFALFPLDGMRHFPSLTEGFAKQWKHLYGDGPVTETTYERHIEYLKRVVPKEKLFFFDVREGWGPLCKILGVEVPDVEFPRINDGEAIQRTAEGILRKGLMRWAGFVAVVVVAISIWLYGRK
jgi:hypothetical protein